MNFPAAAALALALASLVAAEGVRPRTTEDLSAIDLAREKLASGHAGAAAEDLAKLLDDDETVDLAVGKIEVAPTVRGWKAVLRDRAAEWSAENEEFAAAWERVARSRFAMLRPRATRESLEKFASRYRGTEAAGEALHGLSELAWERGDLRAVATLLGQAKTLTALEAAHEAVARRALGMGPAREETFARWSDAKPLGLRWVATAKYPPLSAELVVRGSVTTLRAFLRGLQVRAGDAGLGEVNAPEIPCPPVRAIEGTPQVLELYDLPANPDQGPTPNGLVFRSEAGAGSQLRMLPAGRGAWCAGHGGAVFLSPDESGKWGVRGPGKIRAPEGAASLSSDGRRIFTLVPATPDGRTTRLVPAAIDTAADPPSVAWSGFGEAEDLFDGAFAMGPPLLSAGRLYVPVMIREGTLAPGIVCLDAARGRRIWATQLGEEFNRNPALVFQPQAPRPVLRDGRLFVATSTGVIGAMDAATGDVEWIHVAARQVLNLEGRPVSPAALDGTVLFPQMGPGWFLRSWDGRVESHPSASYEATWCLSAEGRAVLLGRSDDPAPLGFAEVLNPRGGRGVLYELPDPPLGRAALWKDTLTVPTARALLALDLRTGVVDVLLEWDRQDAGDIVRLPGWLVVLKGGKATFRRVRE